MPVRRAAVALLTVACLTSAAGAQDTPVAPAAPAAPDTRYPAVDAALAARDTGKALAILQDLGMRGDAEAWALRARIAARRLVAPWSRPRLIDGGIPGAGTWLVVEGALRNAIGLAPDSAKHWFALARHQLLLRSGPAHHESFTTLDSALAAAHRSGGAMETAVVAYDAAMLFWRLWQQYDGRPEQSLSAWEVENLVADREAPYPRPRFYRVAVEPRPRLGDQELEQATLLLELAADSAPTLQVVRRRHYAALAAAERWEELASRAGRRTRAADADGSVDVVDFLALGLARHRLGQATSAETAFAEARRGMSPSERTRLTSIARILPRGERTLLEAMAPAERERAEERAWLVVDPLWRVPGNEVRLEFLARVAQAELRWGDGSESAGVESDPGAVLVGFGPPTVAHAQGEAPLGAGVGSALVVWRWAGPRAVHVQFRIAPGALEERMLPGHRERFDAIIGAQGAHWANVRGARGVDSIAVQSALFRAPDDSADLFVAARVPTDRLARGMSERGRLALDLWVRTPDGALVRRDSSQWEIDAALRRAGSGGAVRAWRHRLPRGSYLHRVEAWEPVQGRGARGGSLPASLDDASFALRGFGVSQVLVTERVATRAGHALADRWTDYNIVPSPGDLHRDRPVSLLWEVYGDDTTTLARYRVFVTLQPPAAEAKRSLVTQAATGIVGTAVRRTRSKDRVTVAYERQHPVPAGVRVEQVDLGAVKVTPGVYVLRIDVADIPTGRVRTTSRFVTVR